MNVDVWDFIHQVDHLGGQICPAGVGELQAQVNRRLGYTTDPSGLRWRSALDRAVAFGLQLGSGLERDYGKPSEIPPWKHFDTVRRGLFYSTLHSLSGTVCGH